MEDAHSTDVNVDLGELSKYIENSKDMELSFFGVYDGHSGQGCAKFLAKTLLQNTLQDETAHRKDKKGRLFSTDDVIQSSFLKTDAEFIKSVGPAQRPGESSGTTCTTIFIIRSDDDVEVICANVGDSRIVFRQANGSVEPLSYDHKPTNPEEHERIRESGGHVEFGRVNGSLALSRAFGDASYKNNPNMDQRTQAVIALPDIKRVNFKLSKMDDFQFIIVACDGIWDVMTNEQACEYVHARLLEQKDGSYYRKRFDNQVDLLKRQGENEEAISTAQERLREQEKTRSNKGKYDLESITEDFLDEVVLKLESKDNVSAIIVLFSAPSS